ncbi:MAG: hypothetical protein ACAH80_11255, partial [Alphaproteobacteria bacterium]
ALEVELNLPKAKTTDSSSARDAVRFFLSPHVMILRFRASHRAELEKVYAQAAAEADATVEKYSQMLTPDLGSLFVKLNDNTVAIFSLDFSVNEKQHAQSKEGWNRLNEWAGAVVKSMLTTLYPDMIFPLLKGLNEFSNATQDYFVYDVSEYKIFFVLVGDPQNPYPDLHKRFIPMKTNLTYCVEGQPQETRWIGNITRTGATIKLKEAEIHISDENNLVVMTPNTDMKCLEVLWELIASASYYYIAMNVININLIRYIGITSDKHTNKGLRVISRDMENIINSVTILKLRYNDLTAELNGVARKIFQTLQKEWDFKNITDNMQNKLEHCRTNIHTLSVEMQRRNQGRIEVVLTGVAGVTIVGIFMDLAAYASQMPPDRRPMVGSLPGFMDLGFIFSGNTLAWIGLILAWAVVAFTVKHRSG